ncbi:MAG: hypothetical protein R6U95_06845 [Bacteroidales bacterium]
MRSLLLRLCISSLLIISISCEMLIQNTNNDLSGEWKCTESHEKEGERTYIVDISYENQDSSRIRIYNFMNLDSTSLYSSTYIHASVSGHSITIPRQEIDDRTVWGNGTINSSYSSIKLLFNDDLFGGDPFDVSATLTKY